MAMRFYNLRGKENVGDKYNQQTFPLFLIIDKEGVRGK
jgi:hypothetical protein